MDIPPFKTIFAAQIRAVEPSETEVREAKASLSDLKALLPPDINPEDDPQLLYISANLYVAGMVNLNDDGVDIETALATYKGFEKQQLNIEHDRGRVAGYILHAGLSEFGTDRLISEDEARAAGRPFNVAVAAVLWKVNNPRLCAYIAEASSPLHPDHKALSLSFEVGFSTYDIAVIDSATRVISEASMVYRPSDGAYETMAKKLRANGGSGRTAVDSTEGVYQVLTGSFIPLGGGIVTAPAAAVKGIVVITQPIEDQIDLSVTPASIAPPLVDEAEMARLQAQMDRQESEAREARRAETERLKAHLVRIMAFFDKTSLSHTTSPKSRVSSDTSTTIDMNKDLLEQMKQKVASAQTLDEMRAAFIDTAAIADVITAESVRLSEELAAEKARGTEIEANRVAAQAANDQLKTDLAALRAELDGIKAATIATEAAARFDERMAMIDIEFELADDERTLLVDEVKPLDEAGFGTWMVRAKKLMKEKTKDFKKKQKDDKKQKTDEMCAALAARGVKVTLDENDLFKEIIASAQANNVSDPVLNNIEANTKTLKERMEEEFLNSASIGGKKLSEFAKK